VLSADTASEPFRRSVRRTVVRTSSSPS
jgi:hypothetical protein